GGGFGLAGRGPHRGVHHAGVRPAVQQLQLPLGNLQRLPAAVQQPLVVGRGGARRGTAGGRRACAAAAGGLRHRAAGSRALGGGDRDGVGGVVVRRDPQGRVARVRGGRRVTGVVADNFCPL